MLSFYFTQTAYSPQAWEGGGELASRMRDRYLKSAKQRFKIVNAIEEADIVVFWDEYQDSENVFAPKLRAATMEIPFPDRAFVVSFEDRPVGFLPGVYASTPTAPWNEHRFRTGSWPDNINPLVAEAANDREREPKLLYSFVGAQTAQVRADLFRSLSSSRHRHIQETGNLQFNIDSTHPAKRPGQRKYLDIMLVSKFVLCPRGYGSSSFRLFEAMQLGRVPVILSDDWIPPRGPSWQDFSIRIAEHRIGEIDGILEHYTRSAGVMGEIARSEWETWFAADAFPGRVLEWIADMYLSRPHSEAEFRALWDDWIKKLHGRVSVCSRVRRRVSRWLNLSQATRTPYHDS